MSITQRFWLTNSAAGFTPTTLRGAWDATASAVTKALGRLPTGTATTVGVAETSTTNNWDVLLYRGVTDPLDKAYTFTTSDLVQWCVGVKESSASANDNFHVHVYVTTGNSDTPRGTILTDSIGATEWPTTAAGATEGTKALTGLACSAGDRIVVEIGYRGANTSATSFTGTLNYGGTDASLVAASTAVTTTTGWVEFTTSAHFFNTSTITFDPSVKGSHVVLSDGNLQAGMTFAGSELAGSTLATGGGKSSGRVVVRFIVKQHDAFGPNPGFSAHSQDMEQQIGVESANTWAAAAADNFAFWCDTSGKGVNVGGQLINNTFPHPNPGDSVYIAFDIDTRSAYFRLNGGLWYGFNGVLPGGTTPDNDTTLAGGTGWTNAYNWSGGIPSGITWYAGSGLDTSATSSLIEMDALAFGHGLTTFQPVDPGGVSGTGTGTAASPSASVSGHLDESGSGTGTAAAPSASGSGTVPGTSGSGAGTAAAPSASGSGTVAGTGGSGTTLNPSDSCAGVTFSNGNLTGTTASGTSGTTRCTTSKSTGKYVVAWTTATAGDFGPQFGFAKADADLSLTMGDSDAWCFDDFGEIQGGGQFIDSPPGWGSGDKIYIAFDLDALKGWLKINSGPWNGGGPSPNPDTGTSGFDLTPYVTTGSWFPAVSWYDSSGSGDVATLDPTAAGHGLSNFSAWDSGSSGITGTGTGQAAAPGATGSGHLDESGSGAGVAAAPGAAGAGHLDESGSGSGVAAAPNVTAAGRLDESGSGSGTAPAPNASGAGRLDESGSGAGVAGAPQVAAAARLDESGSGQGQAQGPAAAGSGHLDESGSGVGVAAAPSVQGAGDTSLPGTAGDGVAVAPTPGVSAAGRLDESGSGSGAAPAPHAAAAGTLDEQGSGAGVAQGPVADGAGAVAETGQGSGTAPSPAIAAAGRLDESGSGVAVAPSPAAAGSGQAGETGSGQGVAPAPAAGGAGTLDESGSGVGVAPAPSASGAGKQEVDGSGTAAAPAPGAEAHGTLDEAGAGAGVAGSPDADATGEYATAGNGQAVAPSPAASGSGFQSVSGTGAGAAPAPGAAGSITVAGEAFSRYSTLAVRPRITNKVLSPRLKELATSSRRRMLSARP